MTESVKAKKKKIEADQKWQQKEKKITKGKSNKTVK